MSLTLRSELNIISSILVKHIFMKKSVFSIFHFNQWEIFFKYQQIYLTETQVKCFVPKE